MPIADREVGDQGQAKVQHIPYRGSAAAMQDLSGGRIDYLCDAVTTAFLQIQAQSVKAIAVLARNRSPVLSRVPTAHEQGLTDFEASNWIGLFVPRATPGAIIRRLNEATIAAMNMPPLGERAQAIGTDLVAPERRPGVPRAVRGERDRQVGRADPGKQHIRGLRWMVVFSR